MSAPTWPSGGRRACIITGLTGFAISQPLLAVLGDDPATLAHHGVSGAELLLLAGVIALLPALVLASGGALAGLVDDRAGRAVHLALVAGLVACSAIQVAKSAGIEQPAVLLVLAAVLGVGFAIAHVRLDAVAAWGSYTLVLPVLAAVFFVVASPASALLESASAGPEREAAEGDGRASVVFIVLDELPTRTLVDANGELDRARFPNLAAFSDDATWYRHNTTLATYTSAAMPALLTGQLPQTDPPLWTSHPDSLFTLLAPTHDLEVFETVTSMCPYTSCTPTSTTEDGRETELRDTRPGFGDLLHVASDLWLDRVRPEAYEPPALDDFAESLDDPRLFQASAPVEQGETSFGGFGDEAMRSTAVRAEQLMESFDPTDGPGLYYLHLMLPHQPWARRPDGEVYRVSDPVNIGLPEADRETSWSWSDWTGAVTEQRHTFQAQFADRLVGQIMDELEAKGLYDDSLVVVTSDHGISFEAKSAQREVGRDTVDAIGYAPLFIKAPGQREGVVDDSNLMTIDVVPTVADLLGLELGWKVDGVPAGSPAIEARGDSKRIYDFSGFTRLSLDEVIEFSDRVTFATVPNSWLGDLPDPDDPLSALHELLGIGAIAGRPLDELVTGEGGSAQIESYDDLAHPPADRPLIGLVTGRAPDAPDDAVLLLAVDGTVVGGSRLSTTSDGQDGRFAVILPKGALDDANELRVALLLDGVVTELDVRRP